MAQLNTEITIDENDAVTLGKARHIVLMEAAFELEALAFALPVLVADVEGGARYAVRGVSGRLLQLAQSLMSGLDDQLAETSDLERIVRVTSFEAEED